MSRAFVRDPEPGEPRCPGCRGLGHPVGLPTLEALLPADSRSALGGSAFYCDDSACGTAYFTNLGATVPAARLTATSYPKDPAGPICPCTGLMAADVVADAREGRKDRVKELRERAEGPESRCAVTCPDGRSCVARVFRLFRETFETRS